MNISFRYRLPWFFCLSLGILPQNPLPPARLGCPAATAPKGEPKHRAVALPLLLPPLMALWMLGLPASVSYPAGKMGLPNRACPRTWAQNSGEAEVEWINVASFQGAKVQFFGGWLHITGGFS